MTEPTDIFESQYWSKERKPNMKRLHRALGLNCFLFLRNGRVEVMMSLEEAFLNEPLCSATVQLDMSCKESLKYLQRGQVRCITLFPLSYCVDMP